MPSRSSSSRAILAFTRKSAVDDSAFASCAIQTRTTSSVREIARHDHGWAFVRVWAGQGNKRMMTLA